MRHRIAAILAAAALAGVALAADQQANPNPYGSTYQAPTTGITVIRNATILTAAGPAIERGSILLQNGKVAAVGADRQRAGRRDGRSTPAANGSRPA